jgi:hypothetical protein
MALSLLAVRSGWMSFYLIVFQGGNAAGNAVMSVTAQACGGYRRHCWRRGQRKRSVRSSDCATAPRRSPPMSSADGDWLAPLLTPDEPPGGPVMVTVGCWPGMNLLTTGWNDPPHDRPHHATKVTNWLTPPPDTPRARATTPHPSLQEF